MVDGLKPLEIIPNDDEVIGKNAITKLIQEQFSVMMVPVLEFLDELAYEWDSMPETRRRAKLDEIRRRLRGT